MNNKVNLFLFLTVFLNNSLSYSTLKLAKVSPFDKNHPYSKDRDLIPLTQEQIDVYNTNAQAAEFISTKYSSDSDALHAIVDGFDKCATSNMKTLAKHANDVPGRLNKEANAFQNKCYQETLQKLEQLFAQRRTVSEIEKTNATFNYLAYIAVMNAEKEKAAKAETDQATQEKKAE